MTEAEFIAELLDPKSQNAAFKKLMGQYQRPLYSHIRTIVHNHDDTDDVLQNTFVKIYRYLKDFKGDSKLFSWMFRIATNEALTFLKQKSRAMSMSTAELQQKAIENLTSDVYFDGDEIQLKLHAAVARLPQKQQLVFIMKYFQDLKYEEISEIVGTSVGALKASYHHAVKKIEAYVLAD